VKEPPTAALPAGVTGKPAITVYTGGEFRFTFDKAKAAAYFQSIGRSNISLPDKFDGASLVVKVPSAVMMEYGASGSTPGLIVGYSGELEVGTDGKASLAEMRDFLLGLPGLPQDTVRQLRAIQNWESTLPLPIPVNQVSWQKAKVGNAEALVLSDNSAAVSAVVWRTSNTIRGVFGAAKKDDILRVANGIG
jgi:hypothetical protein